MSISPPLARLRVEPTVERVDLWWVRLDPGVCSLEALDDDERAHAARLRVGAEEWAAARGALRELLARALGIAAEKVRFTRGPHGKPALARGAPSDLRFSVSHSGALALVALRLGHDVGVDLERVRAASGLEGVARLLLDPREQARIAADPDPAAFHRAWTRHEALVKAVGGGVTEQLAPENAARFSVRDLEAPAGYAAAVASEGDGWGLRSAGLEPGPPGRLSDRAPEAARSRRD